MCFLLPLIEVRHFLTLTVHSLTRSLAPSLPLSLPPSRTHRFPPLIEEATLPRRRRFGDAFGDRARHFLVARAKDRRLPPPLAHALGEGSVLVPANRPMHHPFITLAH